MTITITLTTLPPLLHRRLYPHTLMLMVKQVIWQIASFLDVAMSGVQTLQGEDLIDTYEMKCHETLQNHSNPIHGGICVGNPGISLLSDSLHFHLF